MNATDDNKEELYPMLSPTAPHAAIANDDIASIFLSGAADDIFLLFFFLIAGGRMPNVTSVSLLKGALFSLVV